MRVGIEAINFYGGVAYVNIRDMFEQRGLDLERFENLMMEKKSVGFPCEDPVTIGVNAAKAIVDQLTAEEKNSIELVITSSESGLDFGKSLSTYIHDYLGLSRHCRLFEVKQACYGGTAAFQMAACFVASQASPGAKALVIATDVPRIAAKNTYAEPSQGFGAIAMLVSDKPEIFELDWGASGQYSFEVMDTCRPLPEIETGDPDLSLLSYLECLENSYEAYQKKVEGTHLQNTFDYLVFHTPFAGMVKGGHRKLMRPAKLSPDIIETDFQRRVVPSLRYCTQVGNVYSATVYLALCGMIDTADLGEFNRVGIFSYGSGCASEFYSGVVTSQSQAKLRNMRIGSRLAERRELNMQEYDHMLDLNMEWTFGIQNKEVDVSRFADIYAQYFEGRKLLVLKRVNNFHREYDWS
ncbi:MAG: hydroxymethylglutaryl-CoA synthase family protein [Ectothiorhodospiraceae bacterium]|nr:hydroxymethylglutaryl-CoA synthase family protein [Ectothiorhodospiraceae bacterium]